MAITGTTVVFGCIVAIFAIAMNVWGSRENREATKRFFGNLCENLRGTKDI